MRRSPRRVLNPPPSPGPLAPRSLCRTPCPCADDYLFKGQLRNQLERTRVSGLASSSPAPSPTITLRNTRPPPLFRPSAALRACVHGSQSW